jgi:hypothetical protein
MESTSQQQVQELAEYLKSACTAGIDTQISAFHAALASYRRASGRFKARLLRWSWC